MTKEDEYIKDICKKFISKINKDIDELLFIYSGEKLNIELNINKIIKEIDKERNKINILVYDKNIKIKEEEKVKSKDIICPKCGEICIIKIDDYKIKLNECKNNHEINILLNEYDDTQNINEIICNNCKTNKNRIYNNELYICGTCNINICPLCKLKHNKEHKIIEYENKNYICNKHNESFISCCKKCKNNLCMVCEIEENNHEIISYKGIIPKKENIKMK